MSNTTITCNMNTFLPLVSVNVPQLLGILGQVQFLVLILGMAIIREEIMFCRRQYFHQVCENLADGNHVEEQKQVQTTVVFACLNLISNLYRK